jgi:spore coat polysaccharide biosynthesis protein SpsF
MRTIAFIQARMTSTRLPGKVLEPLAGIPSIVFMADRVRRAKTVDDVVVVTSSHPSDDELVAVLGRHKINVFRGELEDVLDRFKCAAEKHIADRYVRLTGDCPLIVPQLIDEVVSGLDNAHVEYSSNIDPPSFADGLDVEAFTRQLLFLANETATSTSEREHVTIWMRENLPSNKRFNREAIVDSSHLRITVDYPEDLELVQNIVDRLHHPNEVFDQYDILRYLDENRLVLPNHFYMRNQALQ